MNAATQVLSPLAAAALAMVGDGASPSDVRDRFAAAGAELPLSSAGELLEELALFGLVRVARAAGNEGTYVVTTLGSTFAARLLSGDVPAQLEELERLRTDLLSTIAHEMRTPLTAIRTSTGVLLDASAKPTADQMRALLEVIDRNADRMQRLVGEILDLSRFRSGAIRLQSRRFDARELAKEAAASIRPLAESRQQSLELQLPASPVPVFADHRRLEQALLNLVSNAQRFAPDGGHVRISVDSTDHDVRWVVRDDGPGIPAGDRPQLFERFFVGRSDRNAPRDGVGLGLPMALAIAQAHGGTIDVESREGAGSTFTLVVPTTRSEE